MDRLMQGPVDLFFFGCPFKLLHGGLLHPENRWSTGYFLSLGNSQC